MRGATAEGTQSFRERSLKQNVHEGHFREVMGLSLSTIGLGTYLGSSDEETDELYRGAVIAAARLGCNVLDTAINYRCQRSERALGRALSDLAREGIAREELVVATKGGYVPFDGSPPSDARAYLQEKFFDGGVIAAEDVVAGGHVLTPRFLEHQLERSLENMALEKVDIYYLHNPETQLGEVSRDELGRRLHASFEMLERLVGEDRISYYGTATWNGYRTPPDGKDYLSLSDVVDLATEVAGEGHHCRFVQAPYNLGMTEAFTLPNQTVKEETLSLCQAVEALGVHLIGSASIAQGRLTQGLPDWFGKLFKGLQSDAQRSLQFARSTPGLTTALVGMKSLDHVRENLETARVAPAPVEAFLELFEVQE